MPNLSSPTFDPVRIEITSPGTTRDGRRFYAVDFVEADGGRSDIYSGHDPEEARAAAIWCSDEGTLPVLDLMAAVPGEIPAGTIH